MSEAAETINNDLDYEGMARAAGWVPPEEYKGKGTPKTAQEFVEDDRVIAPKIAAKNKQLEHENADLKEQVRKILANQDKALEMQQKMIHNQYQDKLQQHEAYISQLQQHLGQLDKVEEEAVNDGDLKAVREVRKAQKEAEASLAKAEKSKEQLEKSSGTSQEPDPAIAQHVQTLRARYPDLFDSKKTTDEMVAEVDRLVSLEGPNPAPQKVMQIMTSVVEGKAGGKKKPTSPLPASGSQPSQLSYGFTADEERFLHNMTSVECSKPRGSKEYQELYRKKAERFKAIAANK